jgi:hypothetical protein
MEKHKIRRPKTHRTLKKMLKLFCRIPIVKCMDTLGAKPGSNFITAKPGRGALKGD